MNSSSMAVFCLIVMIVSIGIVALSSSKSQLDPVQPTLSGMLVTKP